MDYLNPDLPSGLSTVKIPSIRATKENFEDAGYGRIVANLYDQDIEIVRWPAQGWRPVDDDSGNEGGIAEGVFISQWKGQVLFGRNEAVSGHYVLGYSEPPEVADALSNKEPERVLMWHANYHPDGGQLFFPIDARPYFVPVALPGDDVRPENFVAFWFAGSEGCYIHPNIWHEGVFASSGMQRFHDRQGKVHARVSVDFAREFQCLLEFSLDS
jgi:hypothetical protein